MPTITDLVQGARQPRLRVVRDSDSIATRPLTITLLIHLRRRDVGVAVQEGFTCNFFKPSGLFDTCTLPLSEAARELPGQLLWSTFFDYLTRQDCGVSAIDIANATGEPRVGFDDRERPFFVFRHAGYADFAVSPSQIVPWRFVYDK